MKKFNFGKIFTVMAAAVAVFAFGVAGCENINLGDGAASGSGILRLDISREGVPAQNNFISASARGPALTVHPVFADDHWDSYVLSFENTSVGNNPADITIEKDDGRISGTVITVTVPVGNYNVTITTIKNSVAVAKGTVAVTVQQGPSGAEETVTMVPSTKADNPDLADGKLKYSIDLSGLSGLDRAALYFTSGTTGFEKVTAVGSSGDVSLTQNIKNEDEVAVPPGIYRVWIDLTRGGEWAGLSGEIVYIYSGEDSELPAKTYGDGNFGAVANVSEFELGSYVAVPVNGEEPVTGFGATQYNGAVAWDPTVTEEFAADQAYTATVTLTALPGYTFDGLTAGTFTYSGNKTSISNTTESGATVTVTIAFEKTNAAGEGNGGSEFDWNNYVIPVTNYTENLSLAKDAAPVTFTVDGAEHTSIYWVLNNDTENPANGNSFTLNPADDKYTVKIHSLMVYATKGGHDCSRELTFTITAASGGSSGGGSNENEFSTFEEIKNWLGAQAGYGSSEEPFVIKFAAAFPLITAQDTAKKTVDWKEAAKAVGNEKYVVLDLQNLPGDGTFAFRGLNGTGAGTYNYQTSQIRSSKVVGIILPDNVDILSYAFAKMLYLEWVEFGAGTITGWGNCLSSRPACFKKVVIRPGFALSGTGDGRAVACSIPGLATVLTENEANMSGTYESVDNGEIWTKTK
ncbi:MAG: hypothetical protein LBJ86_00140 [Spirochaetaceae bacterium]|jgi:hypothetical protein|nr:hypothetical protein [Spirochaetaceae bacterium]